MPGGLLPPLLVELKAKAGEFTAEVGAAKKEVKSALAEVDAETSKFSQKAKALGGGMATVGKAAAIGLAGAAVAIGAEGIKSAIEYQESTAKIAASAGISQDAATKVGDAFLKTAGKSTFSGQEIAAAFGPVAGQLKLTEGHALSASESMTVMQAAMDAAEASGQDLGTTTGDLAGIMQTFGLGVDQASGASDILYNTAKNLNLPIDQVAQGMEKLKGRLGNLAPSMTDTATLLEELGQHGITGTRGVGVMQTALSKLMGGSKNTDATLKALGVHLTDAKGNFVGMGSVISQLQPVLANMTQAQQTQALTSLFGASSAQVMQQVIAGGTAGFKAATDAVSKQGAAQEAAEKQAKSYQGEIKTAKAAISDLVTVLGEKLLPIMAKIIEKVTDTIKWFGEHKVAAIALAAVVGGVLVAAMGVWIVSLFTVGGALSFLIGPIGLIILAVAALGLGIFELVTHWKQIWSDIKQWVKDAWDGIKQAFDAGVKFVKKIFDDVKDFITGHVHLIAAALVLLLGPIGLIAAGALELATHWHQVWDGIKAAVSTVVGAISGFIGNLISDIASIPGQIASIAEHMWDSIVNGFKSAINIIIGAWDSIPTFHIHIPHIPGTDIGGDVNVGLPQIPKLANGGVITGSGMALVGERGPELLHLGAGAQVRPLPNGGGGGQTVHVHLMLDGREVASSLLTFQRQGGVLAIDRFGNALAGV